MVIRRSVDRAATTQPGIATRHAFSAGSHYDADNVSFGPVFGCDEHLVDPGAGFDWHAHRGVVIVSWVLGGTLCHQDGGGAEVLVPAGGVLVQSCGSGIRHRETNPSGDVALRFVQTTILLDEDRSVSRPALPFRIGDLELHVVHAPTTLGPGFAFVGAGEVDAAGTTLGAGDSVRLGAAVPAEGSGAVLLVRFEA